MNPLSADVQHRAVVVHVGYGYAEACADAHLLGTVLPIYIIIRCSVAHTEAVVNVLKELTAHRVGMRQIVDSETHLRAVLQYSVLQHIAVVDVSRELLVAPLGQRKVTSHRQLAGTAIGRSDTKRQRQTVGIGHAEARRVVQARHRVAADDRHGGIVLQVMPQSDDGTQRQLVLTAYSLFPLRTQVQLVAADGGGIRLRQRVRRSRRSGSHRAVDAAPEVRGVDTERERLGQSHTHTEEHLVQATAARITLNQRTRLGILRRSLILITHIRVGQNAERHAHILPCTERAYHIFEVSLRDVAPHGTFLEVGYLPRQPHVEKHGQGVYT